MSTQDTDYTIVVKGKPPEARQAAADYITLLLNPWNPDRSDMKTQVKIEVFRNEMHSRGFLEPVDLAKEAAEFFPGILITVEGKSESGCIDEEFQEDGSLPKAIFDLVAEKVLAKVIADVDSDSFRHEWIEPMEYWLESVSVSKDAAKMIKEQFKITAEASEKAEQEKRIREEEEKRQLLEKSREEEKLKIKTLESLRWVYNPILSLEGIKIGGLGKPYIADEDERSNRYIHVPINLGKDPVGKKILDAVAASQEKIFGIIAFGSARFVFKVSWWGLFKKGGKSELCFCYFEDRSFDHDYFAKLLHESDLYCYDGIGKALENDATTPSVSALVADAVGTYFTAPLPECLFLQGVNGDGKIILNVPAGLESSWAMCMDDERLYLSGGRGSGDEDPRCITAIAKNGSPAWCVDLPIDPERGNSCTKDHCEIMAVAPDLFVYCLKNSDWNEPLIDPCNLVALNPKSGKRLWDAKINQHPSALIMDGSRIYVADSTHLHAFDHQGGLAWSERLPEMSIEPDQYNIPVLGLALDGQGGLLVTLNKKGLALLSCEDGKTRWFLPVDEAGSSCSIGNASIGYLTSSESEETKVHAIDINKGKQIWESKISDSPGWSHPYPSPTVTSKGVFVATTKRITQFDGESGIEIGKISNEFPFPLVASKRVIPENHGLLANYCSTQFDYRLPNSLACIKGDFGTLSGPWPMAGGNGANSNYLPTAKKAGFKEFISDWREGKPVAPRLARLNPEFNDDSQIGSHVHGIIRGRELLKNAREWAEPEIGQGPSAKYRGLQWKLVMAYSGIELLVKSLAAMGKGGLGPKEVADLITKLPLPAFEPIPSPSLEKSSIKAWIEELDQDAVLDFLKTDKGDRSQMQSWLLDQKPCTTWTDALLLAKALTNCTAHGALSPKKVEQWGLAEAYKQLPQALFKIDAAIFEVL